MGWTDIVVSAFKKILSWLWGHIGGYLLDHWKESLIVLLVLMVIGMLKLLLQGLAIRVFSSI